MKQYISMESKSQKNITSSTLLSAKEELVLVEEAQNGNQHAMMKLVEKFSALIYKEARAISKHDEEVEELYSEGRKTLIEAVYSFDTHSGNRLSSYLMPSIRNAVRNFKQEHLSTSFRLPHDVAVCSGKVKKYIRQWQNEMQTTDELPEAWEVADALSISTGKVQHIMDLCYHAKSIDDTRDEDAPAFEVADSVSTDSSLNLKGLMLTVERIISRCNKRDQQIFRLLSPVYNTEDRSSEDVAQLLHLTPQRIRQIYKSMLLRLKADPEMKLYRAIA